jgi:hypothetical protein
MDKHFHALKVAEIVPETALANSIRFEVPEELRGTFAFKAGQHLTLKAEIDGEEVRRNYSLCTAPDEQDWMVTVKRIAGGLFSNWVGASLKIGPSISSSPITLRPTRRLPVLMEKTPPPQQPPREISHAACVAILSGESVGAEGSLYWLPR